MDPGIDMLTLSNWGEPTGHLSPRGEAIGIVAPTPELRDMCLAALRSHPKFRSFKILTQDMMVRRVAAILTDRLPSPLFSKESPKQDENTTTPKWPITTQEGLTLRVKRMCVSILDYPEDSRVWGSVRVSNYQWYVGWYLAIIRMNENMALGFPELRTTVTQFHGNILSDFRQKFGDDYWVDLLFFMILDIPPLAGIIIPDVVNETEILNIIARGGTILQISKNYPPDASKTFYNRYFLCVDDDSREQLVTDQLLKIFPVSSE